MSTSLADHPHICFGPEMPAWGSWQWIGADLCRHLAPHFRTSTFRWGEVPSGDVCVVVKHALPPDVLAKLNRRTALIYCPIDYYGAPAAIDADRVFLQRCARIVVHCERLRRYFVPYAPVDYVDHHLRFHAPLRAGRRDEGEFLWIGVRSNLAPLIEWANGNALPAPLRILTNWEDAGAIPSAAKIGFETGIDVRLEHWSPERHRQRLTECRAVLDVKGVDFRSRHKPPAKALDVIASGVPLVMNPDSSSAEHLARMGFAIASLADRARCLSPEYAQETARFGSCLRELLTLERIGFRWRCVIEAVSATSRQTTVGSP
jgi:hypothetical protein